MIGIKAGLAASCSLLGSGPDHNIKANGDGLPGKLDALARLERVLGLCALGAL